MATHIYVNLDLEIALNLVLQGRIIPHETGEQVAIALRATKSIAYTSSTPDGFSPNTIRGVVMVSSESTNVSLVSGDRATRESLFALIQPHGCPRRVATFSQAEDWLRPLLLQTYQLEREHYPGDDLHPSSRWC